MGGAGIVSLRVNDMDAEPVKGAPFCATVVTEHTQQFADGNRIHTSDNSLLCRDSQGRTRREATINMMGMAAGKDLPKLITIVDPIAGVRYTLDAQKKIALKGAITGPMTLGAKGAAPAPPDKPGQVMVYQRFSAGPGGPGGDAVFVRHAGQEADAPAPTTENLGDQTIDGIHATGTRITTTMPAGKIGNEQPIVATSERWYSPELKATVMTKHNDPWSGELKTQFTNVNTAEPDPSLFTVPDDYKVVDQKSGPFVMKLPPTLPPQ
jgi:hypothetical protein